MDTQQWAKKMAELEILISIKSRQIPKEELRSWAWKRADQINQEYVNSFIKTIEWKPDYMKENTFNFICWLRQMLIFLSRNPIVIK